MVLPVKLDSMTVRGTLAGRMIKSKEYHNTALQMKDARIRSKAV